MIPEFLARRLHARSTPGRQRVRRTDLPALARRLAHFWLVWSVLLLVHETGHALVARQQGREVRRVTVGAGPVLWRGDRGGAELVLRLVPLAGVTTLVPPVDTDAGARSAPGWRGWVREGAIFSGGVLATLVLGAFVAGSIAVRERATNRRWVWGRIVVADAAVLTVFNFLPVPPLDGGRALLGAIALWRGQPLGENALFWVQAGGLALAVLPMTLWTRWTARIDSTALWWRAPAPRS